MTGHGDTDMSTPRPSVSVVMPVHNDEAYVAEAIESILNQTFGDLELIIIDDGSTDRSGAIIDEYARKDGRIRVVRNPKATGRGAARNAGIARAKADLLAFQDSDDLSVRERLEVEKGYMDAHSEVGLVASPHIIADDEGGYLGTTRLPSKDVGLRLKRYCCFGHWAALFRTQVVRDVGGYREGYPQVEDYDLLLRVAERAKIGVLPVPVYKLRQAKSRISLADRPVKHACADLVKRFAQQRSDRGFDDYEDYVRNGLMPEPGPHATATEPGLYYYALFWPVLHCCEYRKALRYIWLGLLERPSWLLKFAILAAGMTVHFVLHSLGLLEWFEMKCRRR